MYIVLYNLPQLSAPLAKGQGWQNPTALNWMGQFRSGLAHITFGTGAACYLGHGRNGKREVGEGIWQLAFGNWHLAIGIWQFEIRPAFPNEAKPSLIHDPTILIFTPHPVSRMDEGSNRLLG